MLNAEFSSDIVVEKGTLTIKGKPITRFLIEREIDRGANGIVLAARRIWLDQPCALKIWLTLRAEDNRDKVQQGLAEARKMAASHPDWVATLYDADLIDNVFFTSMEIISGETLKNHLKAPHNKADLWWLARLYINGIRQTTTPDIAYGDAHTGNVMVYNHEIDKYQSPRRIKFIDYGTSQFTGSENWRNRHWRVVGETFGRILEKFDSLTYWCST